MKKILTLLSLLLILVSCNSEKLVIMHTNDHHGHYWTGRHGDMGLAAQHTIVKELEKANKNVLILSGGDINTGTAESDIFNAEPDFKGMNLMGFDAMVLGNHEFDNPPEVLAEQMKLAKFPMLAANIRKKDGSRAFEPYTIKNVGKYKIALVGLIAQDTPKKTSKKNTKGLTFTNAVEELNELMPELEKKSDFVIVLSHMGYYPDGKHGNNAPGDVTLARNVKGVDMIIGGHTHHPIAKPVVENGTIIVQTSEWGKVVGIVKVELSKAGMKLISGELKNVNLKKKVKIDGKKVRVLIDKEIPQSQAMVDLLTPYYEKAQEKINVVIGSSDKELDGTRSVVRSRQMPIGLLMANSIKESVNADIALMNSGGVRAGLPRGGLTLKNLIEVHPFGNTVCTVTMTGKELKEYMTGIKKASVRDGAYPQVSDVEVIFKGEHFKSFKINGRNVKDDKKYVLAIPSFSANGGDDYPVIATHPTFYDSGLPLDYVVKKYVEKRKGKLVTRKLNRKYKISL